MKLPVIWNLKNTICKSIPQNKTHRCKPNTICIRNVCGKVQNILKKSKNMCIYIYKILHGFDSILLRCQYFLISSIDPKQS